MTKKSTKRKLDRVNQQKLRWNWLDIQDMLQTIKDKAAQVRTRVQQHPVHLQVRHLHANLPVRWQRRLKIAGLALSGIIVVQLIYPSSLALPNTSVAGQFYGLRSRGSIEKSLGKKDTDSSVTVTIGKDTFKTITKDMGIAIDAQKTLQPVLRYRWYQRLIPLSILSRRTTPDYAVRSTNSTKTKAFIASLSKFDIAPTNAAVTMEGQQPVVRAAKNGMSYSTLNQQKFVENTRLSPKMVVTIKGQVTNPKVATSAANDVVRLINKQLSTQFTVSVESQVETVTPTVLASWITTTPDEAKGKLAIAYDTEKIKAYLQPFAEKVYVAGVAKKVSTVDGEVVSEVGGSPGKAMKLDASIEAIKKSLTESQGSAKTIVQTVTPVSVVSATYTRTSKGLQALINDWVKNHKGSFNIALKSANGDIVAAYDSNKKVYPASIYKLYVADAAYTKAAQGQLDLNAATSTGQTVNQCIDLMIVRSDNTCAYAVGDMIGWDANNGLLASQGFGSTTLKKQSWMTTANDTVNYLLKLNNGSLINSEYSASLLSMMQRQIYRAGIPAGSAGGVADKVGFIDAYNHDAGIVYHPNGTYALVIMTSGSSFSQIADLARQISSVMKQ